MKHLILSLLCIPALSLCAIAQSDHPADKPDADNTGINKRDTSADAKTSGDQSNNSEDIKITAAIRRAIVADDSLTATAANVKVITADRTVTLRGPVKSEAERTKIGSIAQKEAGDMRVDNQLEVEQSK